MKTLFLTLLLTATAMTKAALLRATDSDRDLTGTSPATDADLSGFTFLVSEIRPDPNNWCLTATETQATGNLGFIRCDLQNNPANQLWKLEPDGSLVSGVDDGASRCAQQGFGTQAFEGVRIRLGVCDDNPLNKFTWEGTSTKYLKTPEGRCVTNRGPNPHPNDIVHAITCQNRGDYRWNAVAQEGDRVDPDANPCEGVTCASPNQSCDIIDGLCKDNNDVRPCIAVIDESSNPDNAVESRWTAFRQEYPNRPFCLLQPQNPPTSNSRLYRPTTFDDDPRNTFAIVNRDNGVTANLSDWATICGIRELATGGIDYVGLFIDQSGSMNLNTVQASYDTFLNDLSNLGLAFRTVENSAEDWITPFRTVLN
jgi:hypothetical protein